MHQRSVSSPAATDHVMLPAGAAQRNSVATTRPNCSPPYLSDGFELPSPVTTIGDTHESTPTSAASDCNKTAVVGSDMDGSKLDAPASPLVTTDGINLPAMDIDSTEVEDPEALAAAAGLIDNTEDEEVRSQGFLEFRIPHISRLKDQVLSPPIILRGLPWKILVMPRINNNNNNLTGDLKTVKTMGFFLQCNAECDSPHWFCVARADLRIKAQRPNCDDLVKKILHTFCARENDWGFSSFLSWGELLSPDRGFVAAPDDSILLRVDVTAEAPHGVSWDSKRHTGYVGLRNQGATCYMNSLLQTLFFTIKLRRAVYLMPTEADDLQRSIPLALQRVFHDLQFSDKPVGTKKLTQSFGWETLDSFMQHDVQELSRVLLDNIENKMKGTVVEGTIPSLFEGKMLSYVKCKNVDFRSERMENYYDIQLNIKGKKDIHESFQEYIKIETLTGDNKYDAGDYGLQEAEKGVIFLTFPPVLHLQLLRFQYDPLLDCNVKVNDRFEFPLVLDLAPYLAQPDQETTSPRYLLHAVLVHSGDNHGGHYVVYINPTLDGRWARFDDDVVSRVSRREAVEQNFGGTDEDFVMKQCTNAYMLVYVRQSARDSVLSQVLAEDIPPGLVDRLEREKRGELQRRKEKQEAHLYMELHLVLEEDFEGWHGIDLCEPDRLPARVMRVKKSAGVAEVTEQVARQLGRPTDHCRLWIMSNRKSGAFRVNCIDIVGDALKPISLFADDQFPFYVWVQTLRLDSDLDALPHFDKDNDLLIFLKYYDVRACVSNYCGHLQLALNAKLAATIVDECRRRAELTHQHPLAFWEERKALHIDSIVDPSQTVDKCVAELMDGNIIVFQEEDETAIKESAFPSARDYFRDLFYRMEIVLMNKDVLGEEFSLEFSHKATYQTLTQSVAEHLRCPSDMLQFFRVQSYLGQKEMVGSAIKCTYEGTLKDLLGVYGGRPKTPRKLFYTQLKMKISEVEALRTYKCVWVSSRLREERELQLSPPCDGFVRDLLNEARSQVELPAGGSGLLRLLDTTAHKIVGHHSEDMPLIRLSTTSSSRVLRVEEVPLDETNLAEDELVICCAHFTKEAYATFGVPFTLKIREGERFSALRERVQRRLDVPDKEFEKWRFAVVGAVSVGGRAGAVTYISEEEDPPVRLQIFAGQPVATSLSASPLIATSDGAGALAAPPPLPHLGNGDSGGGAGGNCANALLHMRAWLGLDHVNKQPKRPRVTYVEKPIKIHN